MAIQNNIISGANDKITPLISFYAIIDTDFGLLNLINKEYLDTSVFNKSYFDKGLKSIVKDLYNRTDINPLYLISDIDKNILDEYYTEFLETKKKEIYSNSISTDIINLIDIYNNKSQNIDVTILCYNEEQLDIINDEPLLKNNKKVLLSSLINEKGLNIYSQIFVKDISELLLLPNIKFKTVYISSYSPNLDKGKEDFRDVDTINKLIKNKNAISVFDIYKKQIIEEGIIKDEY